MAMKHALSPEDLDLLQRFTANGMAPSQFHHREHLRLAYIFLVRHGNAETAYPAFRAALQGFLGHHGIDPAKYHATLTQAWLLAMLHFMEISATDAAGPLSGSEEFLERHPLLLDPAIMFTHYSRELIKSDSARSGFVEPDIQPIPRHA
jgi:hypothetical protein